VPAPFFGESQRSTCRPVSDDAANRICIGISTADSKCGGIGSDGCSGDASADLECAGIRSGAICAVVQDRIRSATGTLDLQGSIDALDGIGCGKSGEDLDGAAAAQQQSVTGCVSDGVVARRGGKGQAADVLRGGVDNDGSASCPPGVDDGSAESRHVEAIEDTCAAWGLLHSSWRPKTNLQKRNRLRPKFDWLHERMKSSYRWGAMCRSDW